MKKILFLTCLMLSVMTFAQDVKRVAILETVDKQGNISYANKLILRSNLAKAITNTSGYEAYDRTDIDAIMGEQDFQRTGMVSNDQIKRLGEMTGAKYVLVAEAVIVDANNMFITAKLLDVETARTEMIDNQMMGTTAKEIQRGCQLLAEKLIKPIVPSKPVVIAKQEKTKTEKTVKKESSPAKIEKPIVKEGKNTKEEKPVIVKDKKNNALIITRNHGKLHYEGNELDKITYVELLQTCPQAYDYYKNGKVLSYSGWALFGAGFAMQGLGVCIANIGNNKNASIAGIVIFAIGTGSLVTSIPLLCVGYHRKNNAYKVYNNNCASSATPITFNLTAGQNGLGIAMNF